MSTKLRLAGVLGLAAILGGCSTSTVELGSGAPASVTAPPLAAASLAAPLIAPSAASTSAPPSTGPSSGPADSAGPPATPNSIDPCSLLTQTEASTLMGKGLGAGVSTTLAAERVCTFKAGLSEVKVFLTPPAADAATANAFYDSVRSTVPEGIVIDDISIPPFARAGYGSGGAKVPVSGLVVVDNNVGFEVYCGFPACGEVASAVAANLIGGRLP